MYDIYIYVCIYHTFIYDGQNYFCKTTFLLFMCEEGDVGLGAGEVLASHYKCLLQDTDLNHIKA